MGELSREINDLSPERRELLELLLQEEGVEADATLILPQKRIWSEDLAGYQLPLSFAQKRLWFLDQFTPNSPLYNLPSAIQIMGNLDLDAFEQSVRLIISRHESLRTSFNEIEGEPYQLILPEINFQLEYTDLSKLLESERENQVHYYINNEARKPFNLSNAPLFRIRILKIQDSDHILLVTMHHIISDGWSMGVLIREIVQVYQALVNSKEPTLEKLSIQYADFAVWQQKWLNGARLENQLDYWKRKLGTNHPILGLPTDHPRPAIRKGIGDSYFFEIGSSISEGIRKLAQKQGSTLFVTLLAAFATLLHRYTFQEDIRIGTPIAGRTQREIENIIGFFVNTLVIQANFGDNPTFMDILRRVQESAVGAYAHQDLPFEMMVEALHPERDMSVPPLFQVMFSLQNAPNEVWELPGLQVRYLPVHSGTSKFDLSLILFEKIADRSKYIIGGTLEYDTNLFESDSVMRIVEHFQILLASILVHPNVPVTELPMLTEKEKDLLLVDWSTNIIHSQDISSDQKQSIHTMFEKQVENTPDIPAVFDNTGSLTFDELNRRSNKLAHYLRKVGIGPDSIVGILMERSNDLIVGLFGILKAGGAYLPLDPAYPIDRLAYMLNDSHAPILISQSQVIKRLNAGGSVGFRNEVQDINIVCIDDDWETLIADESELNPVNYTFPDNLAYIIYTSGSTGLPKGVMIEHRSALNLMVGLNEIIYENNQHKLIPTNGRNNLRLSLNAPLPFDASVQQWIMLLLGHTIYIIPQDTRLDGDALLEYIRRNELDVVDCVPSQLKLLIEVGLLDDGHWQPQALLPGGEAIDPDTWEILRRSKHVEFYNMYGPTECSVDSTICHVDELSQGPSIGRPNVNVRHYILNKSMQPVPVGVPGELYIGGEGVGRGYFNRPELTAERFLPNPFADLVVDSDKTVASIYPPIDRIYKTGDLVRYLPDGKIDYLGRTDFQVKVRGFRIELGEIEGVLQKHDSIKSAVVITREDTPGVNRLVAYVIPEEDNGGDDVKIIDTEYSKELGIQLREYIKDRLPDYMVPSAFVVLNKFPLTPNAKVDRKALPEPTRDLLSIKGEIILPRTTEEEILLGIWKQVLGIPDISVTDNFFELGGHSLLATQVLSRSRKAFNLDIPLRTIFDYPTITEFARNVESLRLETANLELPAIKKVSRDGKLPLSFGQQRLWFLHQLDPDSSVYNIPDAIKVIGQLDLAALEKSLNEVIRRHEVLRTSITTIDGAPVLVLEGELHYSIPVLDLSNLSNIDQHNEVQRLIVEESGRKFNIADSPLFRSTVLKLSESEWVILFTLHHVISDGWSTGVLINEISKLYPAYLAGIDELEISGLLPELDVQYLDYAAWQREWLSGELLQNQLDYWIHQLVDLPPLLEIPTDHPRSALQSSHGEQQKFDIPKELATALRDLGNREGITLFMLMLAAYQTLLYRYSGQSIIPVGTPIANRNRPEIEGLIGFFVNTLVMRSDFSNDITVQELLYQVRDFALEAYSHQELPFEMIVDSLSPERDLSHTPLFQVMFMLQNTSQERIQLPDLELERIAVDFGISMFDITLVISEAGDELFGGVEYNADLFERPTINRMISHYIKILNAFVSDPLKKISRINLLSEEEERKVIVDWNATSIEYPKEICVHELFENQSLKYPEYKAVISSHGSLTYGDLNQKANQVAHFLKSLGVGPEKLVGISINRSNEMIICLLGILKAGAAYVPLDPSYPRDRLEHIIRDANTEIILTSAGGKEDFQAFGVQVVEIDSEMKVFSQYSKDNIVDQVISDKSLAYVIYTSGSTGLPKGVMVEHRSVVNHNQYCIEKFNLNPSDRVLQFATLNFDTAVEEIFPTLLSGAALVLRDDDVLLSGEDLRNMIEKYGITVLDLPTAYWHEWTYEMHLTAQRVPDMLRLVIVGGEKCIRERYDLWMQVGGANCNWLNTYGPTEGTIISSVFGMDLEYIIDYTEIPIGRPIANVQLYVLDGDFYPAPVGISGELYIGGVGVSRGYLNTPWRTAEKFLPDPFSQIPGTRMYRTGDLVRYLADGNIEFIGRADHQVKVRGFRIELGEIDSELIKNQHVRDTVTIAVSSGRDHLSLVSYVVPINKPESIEIEKFKDNLRDYLSDRLPGYMQPSTYVLIDEIPLTPSNKIDRQALPQPEFEKEVTTREFEAPRTEEEEILLRVWREVLGIETIGIYDNFFELGGDSILSIQVIAKSGLEGLKLSPRNLFENPTIAGLAGVVEKGVVIQAEQGVVQGDVPLTPIQHWFFEQDFINRNHYNQTLLFVIRQPINQYYLAKVVESLISHHDVFRIRYNSSENGWKQHNFGIENEFIKNDHFVSLDLTNVDDDELSVLISEYSKKYQASLDINNGPLLKVVHFSTGDTRADRLLIAAHHLIIDGISWRILLEDFQSAYNFMVNNQEIRFPPKTTSFLQWSHRLEGYAQSDALAEEIEFWQDIVNGSYNRLPIDFKDGRNVESSQKSISISLNEDLTKALLTDVHEAYNTEINDILLSALALAFYRWTGLQGILIEMEGHGREDLFAEIDVSRTVGWFTSQFPVRLMHPGSSSIGDLIKSIKEQLRQIPNHGIGYGLLKYLKQWEIETDNALKTLLKTEVSFNYLGQFDQALPADGIFGIASESRGPDRDLEGIRSTLLDINGGIMQGRLTLEWSFSENIHKKETIESIASEYLAALQSIIDYCKNPESEGFTPSDFPLAELDQKDLDKLLGKLKK